MSGRNAKLLRRMARATGVPRRQVVRDFYALPARARAAVARIAGRLTPAQQRLRAEREARRRERMYERLRAALAARYTLDFIERQLFTPPSPSRFAGLVAIDKQRQAAIGK